MKDPTDHHTSELPLDFSASALADAEAGMAWWNALTEVERMQALEAGETATPAVAWDYFKSRDAGHRAIDVLVQAPASWLEL